MKPPTAFGVAHRAMSRAVAGSTGRLASLPLRSSIQPLRPAVSKFRPASKISIKPLQPSSRSSSTMAEGSALSHALANNEEWAKEITDKDPKFFTESAKGQAPKLLWLGCADSRVPESVLLKLPPGAVFTHRNVANIITATDLSAQSVIDYSVGVVGVQHVVVCGHTACGGVAAALKNDKVGVIDAWLTSLRSLRARLLASGRFEGKSPAEQSLLLVEENVRSGVRAVRENASVIAATEARGLTVHGMVYDLATGLLREIEVDESADEKKARIDAFTTH